MAVIPSKLACSAVLPVFPPLPLHLSASILAHKTVKLWPLLSKINKCYLRGFYFLHIKDLLLPPAWLHIREVELATWRLRKHYKADVLRGNKWSLIAGFSDYKHRCGGCNLLWGWSHHVLCNTSFNGTPAMNAQTIWEILIKHCMSIVGFKGKVEVTSDSWQWIYCLPSESYLDRGCASWRQSHRALWDKLCSEKLSLDSNDQETGGRL